jgi:hypothetical protein
MLLMQTFVKCSYITVVVIFDGCLSFCCCCCWRRIGWGGDAADVGVEW